MRRYYLKAILILLSIVMLLSFAACNDSEVDTDASTDTECITQDSDTDAFESEGMTVSSFDSENDTGEVTEAQTDSKSAKDTEAIFESATVTETVTESQTETEVLTEAETETLTVTETQAESALESATESETATEALTESESESEMETEIENIDAEELVFSIFADFHYEQDVYMSTIEDLNVILDKAVANNAQIVLQMGDLCNDFIGSPEFLDAYLNNKQGLPIYGVYGNHELQSSGNSMSVVTPQIANRRVVWGTSDGNIGDGSIAYYYVDINGFRIIGLDSNYYYESAGGEWKHNPENSYMVPAGGTKEASLGPVQLAWLESVLADAADEGRSCIVMAHHTFNGSWSGKSSDWAAVQEIYRKINLEAPGTVILSMNGHNHTNRQAVIEGVVYLDVNTVYNGIIISDYNSPDYHYTDEKFTFTRYDADGNSAATSQRLISELKMAPYTYFYKEPLSAIITVTKDGSVKIEGMKTEWISGIYPEDKFSYQTPEISSGEYNVAVQDGKMGVEVLYPAYSLGNMCEYVQSIGDFEVMSEQGTDFVRIYGGNSKMSYNQLNIYKNDGTAISGQYLVFKYRIPKDNALDQSMLYMYAGTVNTTATGEQENISIKVSEDGEWHVAVIDLGVLVGNTSGSLFTPAADGRYYAKYIQMRPVTAYTTSGWDKGSASDYMDIAYLALCDSLEDIKNVIDPELDPIYHYYDSKTSYTSHSVLEAMEP